MWTLGEETRGRKALPLQTKQRLFDLWHTHAIVTVDRHNGRDHVSMRQPEYKSKFGDIATPIEIEIEI